MLDLLQTVCEDLDTTRIDLAETMKKLEDLCESPETNRYKFYDRERKTLLDRENRLLEQRLQLWIMYSNGLGPGQDVPERVEEALLSTGDYTVMAVPLLILGLMFMNTFLARSRVRFLDM
jgi:hypothetical protein